MNSAEWNWGLVAMHWRKVAKWIDSLRAEQRDRIITEQNWIAGAWASDDGKSRCLVHIAARDSYLMMTEQRWGVRTRALERAKLEDLIDEYRRVMYQYDRLCKVLGQERVVRACKKRAARGNRIAHVLQREEEVTT